MKKPTPRTPEEITKEIAALNALKPTGPFAKKTEETISLAIAELEGKEFDRTAGEWDELYDDQRDLLDAIQRWKAGEHDERPSTGWEGLVE